ncbi:ATP-binding protein [Erythrobacter sp. SCSIO 43205]|uniref:sensor histidine kinase n=1 Tax=Erythrobacter sp. SCSIO 43205 TaxID=2779361 RepID=UPI001CA9A643|nr:ATP-binding protein [Erythrobacter sp. SCSIO 43205]UAB79232.1 ATP-binding protein [Erythrobacter sp. SCSIO 43205]
MFKVTARAVLELGSELISSDIIAFYELIKNGFDAGTKRGVEIDFHVVLGRRAMREFQRQLEDAGADIEKIRKDIEKALNADAAMLHAKAVEDLQDCATASDLRDALETIYARNSIVVADTGEGMSLDDLERVFLVIGTPSRKKAVQEVVDKKEGKSPYLGEKGIGRLSAMRLGERLEVESARQSDTHFNVLDIDWRQFAELDAMLEDIEVVPHKGDAKPDDTWSGTRLTIGSLSSDWTRDKIQLLANDEFSMLTAPMTGRRARKRIVLRWNGERIKIPALDSELLEEAHASIKGRYEIDDRKPRLTLDIVIRKLGFDHPVIEETKIYEGADLYGPIAGKDTGIESGALESVGEFDFEAHWYNRRRIKGNDKHTATEIKDFHRQWTGIRLYRDGFRVYPYGSEEDDWLGLDRKALMAKGYLLNKIQLIGQVDIGRVANPELVDQTNREGLRVTPEYETLLEVIRFSIQDQLRKRMLKVEQEFKAKREKFEPAKTEIKELEKRAKTSIDLLRKTASNEERETIDRLQMTLFEVSDFARRAQRRIEEVENDAQQMLDMAGIGLMVEIVAHELARTSEDALDNLNALRAKSVPEDVRTRIESLRSAMKSISKRLRVLDPLSVSGRQAPERFALDELIRETLDAHETQFARHDISVDIELGDAPVRIKAVKGMVVQVLENLISNSVYWLDLEKQQSAEFAPKISISLDDLTSTIYFKDNGPGIHPANAEDIFDMFFSLKETRKRRGLGLYIARKCATFNGGALELDLEEENPNGRYNRFIYTVTS